MNLQKSISIFTLFFSAIGAIVGSGWLFGPLYAAQNAGPAAIFSWCLGGFLMIFIAFTFAELSSMFPLAGGMVRFAEISYGSFLSFTLGWIIWLSCVSVAPVETLAIIQYMANFFPDLISKQGSAHVLTFDGFLCAAAIMFLLNILNSFGMKIYSRISSFLVIFKLAVPLVTCLTLIWLCHSNSSALIWHPLSPHGLRGIISALPLGGVIFSFIGYSTAIQLAEEAKNPAKAIPIAIIGSISFCIILYTLLQVAFILALKPEFIANGWHALAFSGDNGPFASLLAMLGLNTLVTIIFIDAIVSPMATGFIYTASSARVSYALSLTGLFSKRLNDINQKGIPGKALFMNYCIGLLLFLPFPAWQKLISFIVSAFVVSYIIGPLSIVKLRKSHPDAKRSFKVPFPNIFCVFAFYICNLLIFWTSWQTVSKLLIFIGIGIGFFSWRLYKQPDEEKWSSLARSAWFFPYLLGLSIISYLGSFGGTGIIPFGYDFLVIALFSIGIYYIVIKDFCVYLFFICKRCFC